MIDFRYHIVSIVAIFIALAIGIVLGAGPLKEDIGNKLSSEVTQLRHDKADLRTQLSASQAGITARDQYAQVVAPAVDGKDLSGKTVAVIEVPGADDALVRATTTTLTSSGATIAATITLTDGWTDPAKESAREATATKLAPSVKVDPSQVDKTELADTVLDRAISQGSATSSDVLPQSARTVLSGLASAGLIKIGSTNVPPASSVVVITGPVAGSGTAQTVLVRSYVDLFAILSGGLQPAVLVAGPQQGDAIAPDTLVTATRKDPLARTSMSTVDDGDLAMGQSTVVLAMVQEYAGQTGHYGLGSDATAVAPQLPAKK